MTARRLRRFAPSSFLMFVIVLVVSASAAALVVVYNTGQRIIVERERAEALAERDLIEEVDQEQGAAVVTSSVARRSRFATSGERYGLFSAKGEPLAGDIAEFQPEFRNSDWRIIHVTHPMTATLHVEGATLPDGMVLVVGRNLSNLRQFERSILYGFTAAVGIVAAAGLAAGLLLNFLILQRVDAIAATAERIAAGDLSARTPVADPRDPFGRVGVSLNAMLERIEELLTGMRTVTDSLAHDLRSPLTRMNGALARALHPGVTEEERLDAIDVAHDEAERMLATLSALLDIARAETGLSRDMMQAVDLEARAAELVDFFAPVIEDAGQKLVFQSTATPVVARAHEALLRQALGNLLHNASVYAGEGAVVTVAVEDREETVRLIVADTGQGVPEDQRGRVQERFVRLDPARSLGGSGLGLAIVAACAKLHDGTLRLEDNEPGLRAVLEIRRN
ncbi:MAG: HAMP domain-containing sensor histidine kinase [Caulobacteraceae bacterium]